ncbi:PLP-dependent aminotransferase family protein [Burkholderia multivorans]|nr:PLP-dependent aminotransferase family protein [Burkholderia multivorans]
MRAVLLTDLLARALSDGGSDTLQHRIYDVVRRGVLDHTLAAGQKLPSSRTLAQELGISRITVSLAYDRLIAENYLVARTGSGTFVAPTSPRPLSGPGEIVHTRHSMTLSQRGAMLDRLPGGVTQSYGPFVPGVADTPMFPFHVWRRLIARHIGKGDLSLSGYALDGGYAPLRAAVARYLKISRSVVCEPEQVIITSGTHQSIDLCARLLADPGDVASAIDAAGLSLNDIDTPARARLVVTSPSHQYPTGAVMPLSRRLELLQSARTRNLWVMEDDYDSEFRYDGMPLPSLQGLDSDARVIYGGTFSKAMYPGVRIAYLVVPAHLADTFAKACAKLYRPGQLHIQAALADFIDDGHFAQHVRRMRIEYAQRQQLLRDALHAEFGSTIRLSDARAGLHLFASFDADVSTRALTDVARADGLILGRPHFVAPHALADRSIVLGYGGVAQSAIGDGVKRLGRAYARTLEAT